MAKLMLNGTQIGVGVEDFSSAGTHGLVPAATSADKDKFLKGDGTWASAGGATITYIGDSISSMEGSLAEKNVYTYGDLVTGTVELFANYGDVYSGATLFSGLPAPYGNMYVYCNVHCGSDSTKKFNAYINSDGNMVAEEQMNGYGTLTVSFTYLKASTTSDPIVPNIPDITVDDLTDDDTDAGEIGGDDVELT